MGLHFYSNGCEGLQAENDGCGLLQQTSVWQENLVQDNNFMSETVIHSETIVLYPPPPGYPLS